MINGGHEDEGFYLNSILRFMMIEKIEKVHKRKTGLSSLHISNIITFRALRTKFDKDAMYYIVTKNLQISPISLHYFG